VEFEVRLALLSATEDDAGFQCDGTPKFENSRGQQNSSDTVNPVDRRLYGHVAVGFDGRSCDGDRDGNVGYFSAVTGIPLWQEVGGANPGRQEQGEAGLEVSIIHRKSGSRRE